jgi:ribosomal protein S18 acetylase RimI-like enzyme
MRDGSWFPAADGKWTVYAYPTRLPTDALLGAVMLYRAYTPADRLACLAIFDSNAERYFSPGDRADFDHFLDTPPGFFGVLCDEAETVVACGGIAVRDDGCTAVLTWGMVTAERHGQGLGKALTLARLERLKDFPGVRYVVMNTSQETVGFYQKLGFHVTRQSWTATDRAWTVTTSNCDAGETSLGGGFVPAQIGSCG